MTEGESPEIPGQSSGEQEESLIDKIDRWGTLIAELYQDIGLKDILDFEKEIPDEKRAFFSERSDEEKKEIIIIDRLPEREKEELGRIVDKKQFVLGLHDFDKAYERWKYLRS